MEEIELQEVAEEEVTEPTETDEPEVKADVVESSEVTPETKVEVEPEAKTEPQIEAIKAPTQEELQARESALAKRESEAREQEAQRRMQYDIWVAQQKELGLRQQEAQAVQTGNMTQEQANYNAWSRHQQQQKEQELNRATQTSQQLRGQAEEDARFIAAQKMAKQYDVDYEFLLVDDNPKTPDNPDKMEKRAVLASNKAKDKIIEKLQADLKAAQRPEPEKFDTPGGSSPGGMDGEGFVRWYERGEGNYTDEHHTRYEKYLKETLGIET